MAKQELKKLLKSERDTQQIIEKSLEQSSKFKATKLAMKKICEDLSSSTQTYEPKNTVELIYDYITMEDKLERILYSQISNFIFQLDEGHRGIFATNIEKLLLYSLDEQNDLSKDCEKIIVKIYDHFNLAVYQIENVKNIYKNSVEELKNDFEIEIKKVEKDYITILSNFTSIVLVFIGEISFSSSVLSNISEVNIFRLLLVIDLLALVAINTVALLVKMIFRINGIALKTLGIRCLNIVCVVFAIAIIAGWIIDIASVAEFLRPMMPWK